MANKEKAVGRLVLETFRESPDTSVTTVIEKYGISKTYAYRLKNKAINEMQEDAFFNDDDIKIPEKFQDVLDKKDFWQYEYEDPEEGWTFWKEAGEELKKNRGINRWIAFPKFSQSAIIVSETTVYNEQKPRICYD